MLQTFMVVAKDGTMYRFCAKKALFLLGPTNIFRKALVYTYTHSYPCTNTSQAVFTKRFYFKFLVTRMRPGWITVTN